MWFIDELNRMLNWKKVEDDGATPAIKKQVIVLWDLVQGRPNPPRQSGLRKIWILMEESTLRLKTLYAKVTSSIKSRHLLSEFLC